MTYPKFYQEYSQYQSILVLGSSEAACILYKRLNDEYGRDHKVVLSHYPIDEPFDLVFDVDRTDRVSLREYQYSLYLPVNWAYCVGLTPSRLSLRDTDHQAQKAIEQALMQLHDNGQLSLPMADQNLFRMREIMRSETLEEAFDAVLFPSVT